MLPDEPLQNNDLNAGIELSMTVSYIFSDQNSKVFLVPYECSKIFTPFKRHCQLEYFSVICLHSFFGVFEKSNVMSVTLATTVPGLQDGRNFLVS